MPQPSPPEQPQLFVGPTLEDAMAEAVSALGHGLTVVSAQKVRAGVRGLVGKERFEVSALPPRSADPVTDAFEVLLERADAAEDGVLAPVLPTPRASVVVRAPAHPAPEVAEHDDLDEPDGLDEQDDPGVDEQDDPTEQDGSDEPGGSGVPGRAGGSAPAAAGRRAPAVPGLGQTGPGGPASERPVRAAQVAEASGETPVDPAPRSKARSTGSRGPRAAASRAAGSAAGAGAGAGAGAAAGAARPARTRPVPPEEEPTVSAAPAQPAPTQPSQPGPSATSRPTGWSRQSLRALGVPADVLSCLPVRDPGDDLGWLVALTSAVQEVVDPPVRESDEHPVVVSGHGLSGALALMQAGAGGAAVGRIGRRPATALELSLLVRAALLEDETL